MISSLFLLSFFVTGSLLITNPVSQSATIQPRSFTSYIQQFNFNPIVLKNPPTQKIFPNRSFVKQTYNNCGPASLSMALSYYNIAETQEALADSLRPHRNDFGIDDDKSVTLEELTKKAKEYDLIPYHRPNGSLKQMKQFITYDMPIITKEWLTESEDIGHYRLLRGYDDTTQEIIQDDSYEGKDLRFSYGLFEKLWSKYNNEYLVLVPKEKQPIAEMILGEDLDTTKAWQHTADRVKKKMRQQPDDTSVAFNLVVAYYNLGKYEQAVAEFEKIELRLPHRTLWYQIEPIQAYFVLGNEQRAFELTDTIILDTNPAVSELYLMRGKIYQKRGDLLAAKAEFAKAVYYNKNLEEAKQALSSLN